MHFTITFKNELICLKNKLLNTCDSVGITHVISCINICHVAMMLFEHEADRQSVQHHPRDPASVNAMKQTYVIVYILAYFTLFQPNESPDLNMDFRSFDNGCKQLYE